MKRLILCLAVCLAVCFAFGGCKDDKEPAEENKTKKSKVSKKTRGAMPKEVKMIESPQAVGKEVEGIMKRGAARTKARSGL